MQRDYIAYSVSDIACRWGQEAMIIIVGGVTNRRAEYKVVKVCRFVTAIKCRSSEDSAPPLLNCRFPSSYLLFVTVSSKPYMHGYRLCSKFGLHPMLLQRILQH